MRPEKFTSAPIPKNIDAVYHFMLSGRQIRLKRIA